MNMQQIPVPDVYKEESSDFRFFLKWFELSLSKIQYDTEEFFYLYDPLRCPEDLLWLLGETMGYRYDDRMSPAFNRLAMVYFMSMIRLKGSKDGVTLAAQVNLDQFNLQDQAAENSILNNRLEDTSIPSNSIYVQPHVEEGYIDLIYFSDRLPIDSCLEYARPVGMYLVPHAGVRYDAKDKLNIDARLTNRKELNVSIGPTHIGHYSETDYSRMQRLSLEDVSGIHTRTTQSKTRYDPEEEIGLTDSREPVWYRNSKYEGSADSSINPGYRALYSLQMSNGSAAKSLLRGVQNLDSITEEDVSVTDESGNTYTQEDFLNFNHRVVRDPTEYVEPVPLGSIGSAMSILEDTVSDDISSENSKDK